MLSYDGSDITATPAKASMVPKTLLYVIFSFRKIAERNRTKMGARAITTLATPDEM
nr:hypothetical protein [Archaeoglobus sp.]